MSHAGIPRAAIARAALATTALLVSCNKDAVQLVEALAPDVETVRITFTCGPVNSIGLTDASGNSAWAFQRHPNNPIQWVVAANVTINSIHGKIDPLPIDTTLGDPHGKTQGTPYKAAVKSHPPGPPIGKKGFPYAIDLTCTSGTTTTNLVLDPEMIIKKP
jgi:hypothetical protein